MNDYDSITASYKHSTHSSVTVIMADSLAIDSGSIPGQVSDIL